MTRSRRPSLDEQRAAVLKAFLLRAEALGWVTVRGGCRNHHLKAATAYWAGVYHMGQATGKSLFSDKFHEDITRGDPVRVARAHHVLVWDQLRSGDSQ